MTMAVMRMGGEGARRGLPPLRWVLGAVVAWVLLGSVLVGEMLFLLGGLMAILSLES